MFSIRPPRRADDFEDFAGDLVLAGAVVSPREVADHRVGIFRGGLHRHHPGDLLGDRGIEEALEQPHLEAHRHDFLEDARRRREELVLQLGGSLFVLVFESRHASHRQQRFDHGLHPAEAFKPGVNHVEPVDLSGQKLLEIAIGEHFHFVVRRAILKVRVLLGSRHAAETESGDAAFARNLQPRLGDLGLQSPPVGDGGADHAGVVAAAQPAVGGQHQQRRPAGFGARFQERVAHFQSLPGEVTHQRADPARVGRGGRGPVHGPLESGRGDQLHRPRDLADVADRLATLVERSGFAHGLCRRLFWGPRLGATLPGPHLLELAD